MGLNGHFKTVYCLDTGEALIFQATTPYEAMRKLLYYLNLSKFDGNAVINKTKSNLHLYTVHNGNTWSIRM